MPSDSRLIKIADDAAELPEDLLLAQSKQEMLFLAGAGVSMGKPANLPNFRELVREVYRELDPLVYPYLDCKASPCTALSPAQRAEISRYCRNDFDVALGLLERRIEDDDITEPSRVREAVQRQVSAKTPTPLHRALSILADRGNATAILTTNFDRLFERCTRRKNHSVPTYGLGGMPRPSRRTDFTGIFHIHGVLPHRPKTSTDLVLTDRDFGEYYFRRRFIPDLLYDASRIYQLVLIGYSADDPPMRYLLNAIAADTKRFHDIRPPYIFVPDNDARLLSDLEGRGLKTITYCSDNHHIELTKTIERWAAVSTRSGAQRALVSSLIRAGRSPVSAANPSDIHLVSHLVKRGNPEERRELASAAGRKSHPSWLSQMLMTAAECYPVDENSRNKASYEITCAFLESRLTDSVAVHWATALNLHLDSRDLPVIRRAIASLLDQGQIPEPWSSAWRWVQGSWSARSGRNAPDAYHLADRLRSGDRSASLVEAIARLVEPPLLAEPAEWRPHRRRPKTVGDLLWIHFGDVDFIGPDKIDFAGVGDANFLIALCHELDWHLSRAIETARRLYGDQGWQASANAFVVGLDGANLIGALDRDTDAYGRGISPLLQMLYTVLRQATELDDRLASTVPKRWEHARSFIHRRLWAAVAKDKRIVSGQSVGEFLAVLDRNEFWDFEGLPEVGALRARRFRDLAERQQKLVATRLRRGPPRFRWLRHLDADKFAEYRKRRILREFQEILDSGGVLSKRDTNWMAQFSHLRPYPDPRDPPLEVRPRVHWRTEPDSRFDHLLDSELPDALEAALATKPSGRQTGGYRAAKAWVQSAENWPRIISGLEALPSPGTDYRNLWDCFGWAHHPGTSDTAIAAERQAQGERVLTLIEQRPVEFVGHDISGLSVWFDHWKHLVTSTARGVLTALKFWRPACRDTDRSLLSDRLKWMLHDSHRRRYWSAEQFESSVLNTSAGRIAGVLASGLTGTAIDDAAISVQIRDRLGGTPGLSGMIAKYCLALHLWNLWCKNRDWTQQNIIDPMLSGAEMDLTLWIAFVRASSGTAVKDIVEVLGDAMIQRTLDPRLDTRTRRALAVLVMRYFLFARWNGWEEKVSVNNTQQALRQSEAQVLSHVVHRALLGFLDHGPTHEASAKEADARAQRFRRAVGPVLEYVWPMERKLGRPILAKAMSQIPGASGVAFADSVDAVRRFLYPFKIYTVRHYGFHGRAETLREVVRSERDAGALLDLLDRTVGEGDEARMPFDGDEALARIRTVAPRLAKGPTFRRLEILQKRSIFE